MKGAQTARAAENARSNFRVGSASHVRRILFFVLLLAAWEAFSRSGIREDYLFPGPSVVAQTLFDGIVRGDYLRGALVSMQRIAVGYGISMVLGVTLGALIARNTILDDTVGALVIGLQALPSVCWLPLAILWLGLNESAIQFVVVIGCGITEKVIMELPYYLMMAVHTYRHHLKILPKKNLMRWCLYYIVLI
jgi:NitT/TauT family transport system permease protein